MAEEEVGNEEVTSAIGDEAAEGADPENGQPWSLSRLQLVAQKKQINEMGKILKTFVGELDMDKPGQAKLLLQIVEMLEKYGAAITEAQMDSFAVVLLRSYRELEDRD